MVEIINECLKVVNDLGGAFSRYAAGAFLQSALLVVVLFAIDLLLRKWVRAVFRYCIWLLVLVKLVLPPTLSLPTGIGYWVPDHVPADPVVSERLVDDDPFEAAGRPLPSSPQPSGVIPPVAPSASVVEPEAPVTPAAVSLMPITWKAILLLLWLGGMLAFAAVLIQRIRFVRGLVAASTAAQGQLLDLLEACRRQMGVRGQVELRTSDSLSSPAVCGLLRPTILMPASLAAKLSPEGLRATLIHELAHIKRADLWVNAVQTLLQVVYFYNPFVWLANAMIRRTCEEAVDETVLVTLGGRASDYSNTLISIGEMAFWKADFGLRLVGVAESKRALKRRIKYMLTRPVPHSAKIGTFGTIVILIVAAVLLPMARGERSNQEASATPDSAIAGTTTTALSVKEGDTLIDPNTGVKFVLAKTISGANNVIGHVNKLIMSPDARFLLFWGRVIPLDGTETFRYAESGDVRDVAVSPNGRYIAHGQNAVWLQPVSPETLRPAGPAKKLLDLRGGSLVGSGNRQTALYWTRDSQTVFFTAYDAEGRSRQYAFSAATGAPVSYPDGASAGLRSPDGKCIALADTRRGFWVKPIGDGAARMLCEAGAGPVCWSEDGRWLIGAEFVGNVRFVRYPEGQDYLVSLPKELAEDDATLCVGPSADRKMLYSYQASTKLTYGVRLASAEGTALSEVDVGPSYNLGGFQWARDGKALFHTVSNYQRETTRQWKTDLLMSHLSGEKPIQFTLNPFPSTDDLSVSPDGKWLRFWTDGESGRSVRILSAMPLSIAGHEASGPTTVLFRMTPPVPGSSPTSVSSAWSPDSTRVALACKADGVNEQDIWVAFIDGRTPVRLTRTAAIERDLKWSPDGKMLAFLSDDAGAGELKVIPSAGGDAVVIRKGTPKWGWSPDSKSLTLAEEGMLVRQSLSGGEAEPIINLKEYGIEGLKWHGWSPDGSRLALAHWKQLAGAPLNSCGQLLFARVEGGRLQKTGAVDMGPATNTWSHAWSPDGAHVAYEYEGLAVMRPDGRLYAVVVDDVVKRIEAGAIPATRRKAAEPTVTKDQSESQPTPQPEPIGGSVFSDNFDNGLSKCWQIVAWNANGATPPAHAVENGQLMLVNSSARLSQIDWADYLVTVRVCSKEGGGAAIQTRATPSNFDIKNMDHYGLIITCNNNASTSGLRLQLLYSVTSGARYGAPLGTHPCTLVPGKWYKLAFEVRGEYLRGYLDDKLMIETTDARLSKGAPWITAASSPVLFDDFSVRRLP